MKARIGKDPPLVIPCCLPYPHGGFAFIPHVAVALERYVTVLMKSRTQSVISSPRRLP